MLERTFFMKELIATTATLAAMGATPAHADPAQAAPEPEHHIVVTHRGPQATMTGPEQWFTGAVRVDMVFQPQAPARASAAQVSFEPGARTAWHAHPLGQTLVVTAGRGWVQEWGGPRRAVEPGDVVWIPPGVKHWHGADTSTAMSHLAVQESLNGSAAEWMEHVSDAQYSP